MKRPTAIYRLRLHEGFGFADVGRLAGYLAALGVSHVCLSPILQSAGGSPHGPGLIEDGRVSDRLGGETGFRRMADHLREHGLKIMVDVAPGDLAAPADPEAFEATHAVLPRLVRTGLIHGLRVDRPDELADPRGSLRRLAGLGTWLLAGKVLTGDEPMPPDRPCAGTTGHDALGMVGGVFVDPAGERPLIEAGGDPARFAVSPAEFHAYCARIAADRTRTLTTLCTDETKWSEDVRARLAVLSELPEEWLAVVRRWRSRVPDGPLEPDLGHLMWQTLVGGWPLSAQRLRGHLVAAMRDARTRTSWPDPDPAYEDAVLAQVDAVFADHTLTSEISDFVGRIAPYARAGSLGQKLVQLTMPGVPDVHQGCEFACLALADPGDRRPIDFAHRRETLADIDAGTLPADLDGEKLLVTTRALRLREEHPDWFAGDHEPADLTGPAAAHAVAFRRGGAVVVATRLPVGLERHGGWGGTRLNLTAGTWCDILTGQSYPSGIALTGLLTLLPVALLIEVS